MSIKLDLGAVTAYAIAVKNGFEGTEADWLASLKGAKGDKGDQGDQGPQGIQGIQGIQGEKGDKGDTGPQGETGPAGAEGKTPEYGVDYGTPEQIQGIAQYAAESLRPEVNQIKDDLTSKIDKPTTAPAVGKILKVTAVNDDGTFTCEWADAPSGGGDLFETLVDVDIPADPTADNSGVSWNVSSGHVFGFNFTTQKDYKKIVVITSGISAIGGSGKIEVDTFVNGNRISRDILYFNSFVEIDANGFIINASNRFITDGYLNTGKSTINSRTYKSKNFLNNVRMFFGNGYYFDNDSNPHLTILGEEK